jgi:signal transduction histidine kinase
VTGEPASLHPQAEVTLLRATQEALTNVRHHAAATRVTVTLSYFEDLVILDVQDDGRGFAPEKLGQRRPGLSGGFGLLTMQERAAQLGGKLTVESAPGEGTTVTVELPL